MIPGESEYGQPRFNPTRFQGPPQLPRADEAAAVHWAGRLKDLFELDKATTPVVEPHQTWHLGIFQ